MPGLADYLWTKQAFIRAYPVDYLGIWATNPE